MKARAPLGRSVPSVEKTMRSLPRRHSILIFAFGARLALKQLDAPGTREFSDRSRKQSA